jgi:membrane-bound lytic murein transglycosylase B
MLAPQVDQQLSESLTLRRRAAGIGSIAMFFAIAATLSAAPLQAAQRQAKAPPTPRFDLRRPEIKTFIEQVRKQDGLKTLEVRRLMSKAVPQPKIIDAMNRPAEKVSPWWEYRARFLTEQRIREGLDFWTQHREVLERIADERGVPPEYLAAIVGVETYYGRITGSYRVIDALATLAFDYPPRASFFRAELEQFLILTREEQIDPLKAMGSYAGAMGAPQFMPSSYRRFAVDGGSDGRRNLWTDWDDVLASIANYLRENGWETGAPVVVPAILDPNADFQIDTRNLDLNETIDGLNAKGVRVDLPVTGATPVVLISAEEQDGPAYRVGFGNFRCITRYNRSARYAMAVSDLAQALAERMRNTLP